MWLFPNENDSRKTTFLDDDLSNSDVDKYLNQSPKTWYESLRLRLEQSRTGITIEVYLAILLVSSIVFYFIGLFLFENYFASLILVPIGYFVPQWYVSGRRLKMIDEFDRELIRPLDRMVSVLISSKTPIQAIEEIVRAKDMPEVTRKEFEQALIEVRFGSTIEDSFKSMAKRTGSENALFIATQMAIYREQGGDLAEILSRIRTSIQNKIRIKGELESVTSEQRSQVKMIIGLFVLVMGVTLLTQGQDRIFIFGTIMGRFVLLFCVGMMVIGTFITNRMTR